LLDLSGVDLDKIEAVFMKKWASSRKVFYGKKHTEKKTHGQGAGRNILAETIQPPRMEILNQICRGGFTKRPQGT